MSKLVLTVDDHEDIRKLIRLTLEFQDYDVIEACNGEEGLALARMRRPDLVLLDVLMPGMSGLEVSRAMAEDPELSSIPVVMLSALEQNTDVSAGYAAGARAYLGKPFSPSDLVDVIECLIGDQD
ncbi:response regulator [Curvibacter sp. RS43]|uniref:Response regulator n=1 Tax=Curvibacter microcysteis TaxID=3026419 RepID=A0ABT5MCZ3_9BURK|nr:MULTISPECIES: response regulator [unclassified Curvibacter]MDD0809354.1 response regulator [Curvibacter sp. RS43]MDD0814451.1 response regulator [Curvibacter sp. HBC28]